MMQSVYLCVGSFLRAALLASALLVSAPGFAQAPPQFEATLKAMLAAVEANSVADFVAAGDAAFQSGMTQLMLESLSRSLAPRLQQGYTATFLATLKQQGYTVYLWKLEFTDRADDILVTMAVRDGKVGGFWLR